MEDGAIKLTGQRKSIFLDKVKELLPEGGNLNLCLTCGACASGCPASGLENMDPRKFLRLAALGMDEEILKSNWVWMCSMCQRCIYVCPMKIDIPQLVYNARGTWPRDQRPKGILGSCDMALRNDSCSAMGTAPEDFQFVVEDVLAEYQEAQPEFAGMEAPIDKQGAMFFLNQNSREPVTEPDEMVPLGCGWNMMEPTTIEDLERRWEKTLMRTERAVSRERAFYLELKTLVRRVNSGPLDVSEYHGTASRMGDLLERIDGGEGTLFTHYKEEIDPRKRGRAVFFRFECRDLAEQIAALEKWRMEHYALRVLK